MLFLRTKNFDAVRLVLTQTAIYSAMGDDYTPPINDFQVNQHPDIWYLEVGGKQRVVGLFSLIPQNRICWELHVAMLPWASIQEKWSAARELAPWLASNTECRRLTAAIPEYNRRALIYGTHGIGMHIVGRQEKAFMKDGELRDLILLGRAVG